jgi:hypothetical protein
MIELRWSIHRAAPVNKEHAYMYVMSCRRSMVRSEKEANDKNNQHLQHMGVRRHVFVPDMNSIMQSCARLESNVLRSSPTGKSF